MSKKSIVNALSASAYIVVVASVMNFISETQGNKPDTVFAPIIFLSLLTLSVAVMAYLFFYQPLLLLVNGKKKESLDLFVQTVGAFAVIVIIALVLLLSGII
ncbi:MAG: hypothetical protein BroJett025_07760 [Patescibacteria group bacterium]|nr:MAG: hypothetical protein BroJett025_07760 [Patescibacteria group bacterium]